MVNFGLLAAEIVSLVWSTPANFNGFRVLAALLHGTLVVSISQTAAFNRGRHLYSAGRPSGWALAHISSYIYFCHTFDKCCVICVLFSQDAHMKAVGRGLVWRLHVTLAIVIACQLCQAFRKFHRRIHARPNIGNVVLVLSDDALAVVAGMLLMTDVEELHRDDYVPVFCGSPLGPTGFCIFWLKNRGGQPIGMIFGSIIGVSRMHPLDLFEGRKFV